MTAGSGVDVAMRRARAGVRTLEAVALLVAAAAAQRWVHMPRWSPVLGQPEEPPDSWQGKTVVRMPTRAADFTESRVAVAVRRACRVLPFEPTCLAQASAGQVMLRRRHHPGLVVIGLRREDDGQWAAHAWLLGKSGALTGGAAAKGFTATVVFRAPGSQGIPALEGAL